MVPKLASKGTSFKGAAAYYLHDKGADTSERVAWTATVNLATDNPEIAWRIMAATAKEQDRLKAAAGIGNAGRKSADVVLAYSLAWHPDEKAGLTLEEMLLAARASLEVLGASDRQALIVCHSDEPHPHVHVIVNRVSPEDGRMLSSSKEKLNLSRWAEGYERARGKIWCEERVANNEARDKLGQFTRAARDKPRRLYETEQAAKAQAKDYPALIERARAENRTRDAALAQRGRELHARHAATWEALRSGHKARKEAILAKAKAAEANARKAIQGRDRPQWRSLFRQQFREQRAFSARESRLAGKIQNAIEAIRGMGAVRGEQSARGFLGTAFRFLTSSQAREAELKRRHEQERRSFAATQKAEIRDTVQRLGANRRAALKDNLDRFQIERNDLKLTQGLERAALKTEWRQRNDDRRETWAKVTASARLRRSVLSSFRGAERDKGIER